MTTESKLPTVVLLLLMGIVILLMVAIIGLFVRMNQLQQTVLAALTASRAGAIEQEMGLQAGTAAPAFALSDTAGTTVSLRDFAGRRVLLVFASPRCPPCVAMYPHLEAFGEGRADVQVVMVSRGSVEENRRLAEEQGFEFPVLTWEDGVAEAYQVPGTPFFYVVDETVASFLLAVVAFALPAPAAAYCLPQRQCWTSWVQRGVCGNITCPQNPPQRPVLAEVCCWQYTGTNPTCQIYLWCEEC